MKHPNPVTVPVRISGADFLRLAPVRGNYAGTAIHDPDRFEAHEPAEDVSDRAWARIYWARENGFAGVLLATSFLTAVNEPFELVYDLARISEEVGSDEWGYAILTDYTAD